jgi:DNA helicase-2/ATP-dependent DNA helicase PcrA
MPGVFRYNDAFSRKHHPYIAYLVDHIEPASAAFLAKRYGAMFEALGKKAARIASPSDKTAWSRIMNQLCTLRATGTVGDVIGHISANDRFTLPDDVVKIETELRAGAATDDLSRRAAEAQKLKAVAYKEIVELARYHQGHSPFETKHGVKGDEFENVLGVFGRGWNDYDFNELLEMIERPNRAAENLEAYERYRNLFYVVCSRPKKNLALLFTQRLSPDAISAAERIFGAGALIDIGALL